MSGRNQKFRQLVVESLENREMLSASPTFDPSPEALELLERINRMRIDPQGELSRIFSDLDRGIANDPRITSYFGAYSYPTLSRLIREFAELTPAAPLAWDNTLADIANEHTALMISRKIQAHTLPGELSLEQRLIHAGFYDPESGFKLDFAENITAFGMAPLGSGYGSVASFIHEFLVIDFGNVNHIHRDNVMDPNFTLVGIGLQEVPAGMTGFGPWVATVDFASFSNGVQLSDGGYLVGVAYDDLNDNFMYEAGEGLGGMEIVIRRGDEVIVEFETSSAGAYQYYLENGEYTVTVSGASFPTPLTQTVVVDGRNVKTDFRVQDAASAKPVVDLNGADAGIDFNVAFVETMLPSLIVSPDLTVTAGGWISYAVVQLQDQPDGNHEMLLVDVGGTSLSSRYDSATGTLIVSGTAAAADYAKVLQTLSYQNLLDKPHLEERIVCVIVSDGFQESDMATSTVKMTPARLPVMTIEDARVIEGDEGTTDLVFVVELSEMSREMIVVNYEVVAGTAIAGIDFTPTSGRMVFDPWEQTSMTITVAVNADYDPGEDRTVLLNIFSVTNADLSRDQIVGTILEDDNVIHLGRTPSWNDTDLEFVDGRRLLYSFEAMYNGRVSWDTVPDSLPEGTRMVVYESSHSTFPIGYSTLVGDKQHLEFDVTDGMIYVVKIEGTVEPELLPTILSTKMMLAVRIIEDGYEILGNPGESNEYVIDFSDGELQVGYDGVMTRLDPSWYPMIRFGLLGEDDSVTIIGGGSKENPIVVVPDEVLVVNDVAIDISGLQKIDFAASDGYDCVEIFADGDNCLFTFQDGNTILVTETRVYRTFGVEQVSVIALGADGVASFFDLPSNDTLTLRSNHVLFEGGDYHIETRNFQTADFYSVSGGSDTAMIYGENDCRILVADYLVQRLDALTSYRVWNTKTIVAVNADDTNNAVTFLNMTPREKYYVAPGCVSASNAQQTVSWQAFGFNDMAISQFAGGSCSVTVSLEEGSSIVPGDGSLVLMNGLRKVTMPLHATYTYRQDSAPTSALSLLSSSPSSSSTAAVVDALHSQAGTLAGSEDLWISSDDLPETFPASRFEENGEDRLLHAMARDHYLKDRDADATSDPLTDDETDLLRFFARRVALLQTR